MIPFQTLDYQNQTYITNTTNQTPQIKRNNNKLKFIM